MVAIAAIVLVVFLVLRNRSTQTSSLIAYISRASSDDTFKLYLANVNNVEQSISLTSADSYRQNIVSADDILRVQPQPFSLRTYQEYAPVWSPQGCQIVYGAQVTIDRYFLQPGETLSDVQVRLGLTDETILDLAAQIRSAPIVTIFLGQHPEYIDSQLNGYLTLLNATPTNGTSDPRREALAVVNYLLRVAPAPTRDTLYRYVSRLIYDQSATASSNANLYLIDLRNPIPELLLTQVVYGNTTYFPTRPDWSPDGNWIAFEYTSDLNNVAAPSFIGLLNVSTRQLFALRPETTRGKNGLYYDGEPRWWQAEDKTLGLVFVSRNLANHLGNPLAQIYRLTFDQNILEPVVTPTIGVQPPPTLTPVGTPAEGVLPIPTPTLPAAAGSGTVATASAALTFVPSGKSLAAKCPADSACSNTFFLCYFTAACEPDHSAGDQPEP